jgi:hypothetical protein
MSLVSRAEHGVNFWSEPAEQETLDIIRGFSAECIPLIETLWKVPLPRNCRVYVMTRWSHLLLHAAPLPVRGLYTLLLPLIYLRTRRVWTLASGLTIRYRGRPAIGVKPIRLWDKSEQAAGKRIFYKLGEDLLRLRNVVCHEMTHAYTAHLQLPLWLNEGVAMVTVDIFLQRQTVQHSTLQCLRANPRTARPADYVAMAQMNEDAIVYAYAHGYWVTRYLFETRPDILQRLLATRMSAKALEGELVRSLGLPLKTVWQGIDTLVLTHFAALEHEHSSGDQS